MGLARLLVGHAQHRADHLSRTRPGAARHRRDDHRGHDMTDTTTPAPAHRPHRLLIGLLAVLVIGAGLVHAFGASVGVTIIVIAVLAAAGLVVLRYLPHLRHHFNANRRPRRAKRSRSSRTRTVRSSRSGRRLSGRSGLPWSSGRSTPRRRTGSGARRSRPGGGAGATTRRRTRRTPGSPNSTRRARRAGGGTARRSRGAAAVARRRGRPAGTSARRRPFGRGGPNRRRDAVCCVPARGSGPVRRARPAGDRGELGDPQRRTVSADAFGPPGVRATAGRAPRRRRRGHAGGRSAGSRATGK